MFLKKMKIKWIKINVVSELYAMFFCCYVKEKFGGPVQIVQDQYILLRVLRGE